MATHREARFPSKPYFEPNPLPADIPHVEEVGTTSAPLKSASFFLGDFCKKYNEDFMLCKAEKGRDPKECLKEGRRVTRCTQDFIRKLSDACGKEWERHYECLENHNQEFYACRKVERPLNDCVFSKLKLEKKIPGAPEGQVPIQDKKNPIFIGVQR